MVKNNPPALKVGARRTNRLVEGTGNSPVLLSVEIAQQLAAKPQLFCMRVVLRCPRLPRLLGTLAYERSLDGAGGWISRFGRLPPAETGSFYLITGVDVEGRRGTCSLAGAVAAGTGAGAGGCS